MTNTTKHDIVTPTTEEIKREQLIAALANIIKKYAESKQSSK